MVSPLKIPLPAAYRRKWGQVDRSKASKERSLMKRVQSEVFITAKPRALGIRLVWAKYHCMGDELQGFTTYITASPYGVGFQGLGGP